MKNSIISNMYNYQKIEKGYIIEKNKIVVTYCESLDGAKRLTNYLWMVLLFLFGIGFFLAGISSYYHKNFLPFQTFSNIEFIPQGILLLFYGTAAFLLSCFIYSLISWDIGSGTNIYDLESSVVRLSRRGFPSFDTNLRFKQKNIYLVYPFSEIINIELNIVDGINPTRILYLNLKDGRRIPLTPSNQLTDLAILEKRAIFITKLLKSDLKLNNNQ
jgi:hypothetical protein